MAKTEDQSLKYKLMCVYDYMIYKSNEIMFLDISEQKPSIKIAQKFSREVCL